jgi:hypothetical protein
MRPKIEPNVIIPLGVCKRFMSKWKQEVVIELEDDESEDFNLEEEIEYPPLGHTGEIYWKEMSYNRLTQNITCWNYDYYSNGNW